MTGRTFVDNYLNAFRHLLRALLVRRGAEYHSWEPRELLITSLLSAVTDSSLPASRPCIKTKNPKPIKVRGIAFHLKVVRGYLVPCGKSKNLRRNLVCNARPKIRKLSNKCKS